MEDHNKTHYRRSTLDDAQSVFVLVSASVRRLTPTPYSAEVVATWMSGRVAADYNQDCRNQEIWIAESMGHPIGFSHGVPGEVKRLFVDANHIGKGAGAGLMRLALDDAMAQGTTTVRIEATLNAVPFYQAWGFKEVGHGVFPGRTEDLPAIDVVILEAEVKDLMASK